MNTTIDNRHMRAPARWPKWVGYPFTILLEAALTAGLLALRPYLPLSHHPIFYVIAIMAVAYWFGEGPAIFALFIGLFTYDYFFVPPFDTFWPLAENIEGWASFTAFFFGSALVASAFILIQRSRRHTELMAEELRESNEHTTNILESITDAFFVLDRECRFIYVNCETERLLRKARDDLLGKGIWEVFPKAVGSRFYNEYHRAIAEQVTVEFEEWYPPLETWFWVRAFPSAEGLSVYFQNITERKQTEQEVRDREEELATIYDNAPLIMLLVDEERRVRKANRLAMEFVRAAPGELVGQRGGEALRCLHALDDPRGCGFGQFCQKCAVRNTMVDTLQTGRAHHFVEATLPFMVDGESRNLTFLLSTSRLNVRGQSMALVTLLDITEMVELRRTAELKRTIERHLNLLQQALAPPEPSTDSGYNVAAVYVSAFPGEEIGGDFYDCFKTENGRIGATIGDVSGSGIQAAALAAVARSTVHSFAYALPSPGAALSQANAVVQSQESKSENFVTVFLVVIDPETGLLSYARAGHPPAAVWRADGRVQFLEDGDPAMCISARQEYETFVDRLDPGDKIALYTDGILEARRDTEFLDVEGIRRALVAHGPGAPDEVANGLLEAARQWQDGPLRDDVAILVIERESQIRNPKSKIQNQ